MRLSNRDLVLLIGIVVAVAITLTALVYKDQVTNAMNEFRGPKKTSWSATAGKLLEFIGKRSNVRHFQ
jgi:hypothetical protein